MVTGCSSTSQTSVAGKVSNEGKPVEQGDITFFNPVSGEVAQGSLGEGGAYTLMMPEKGLSPGDYKVIVAPTRNYELVSGPEGTDYEMIELGGENIPKIYRDRVKSPLKATIVAGENTIDFELKK